MPTALCVTAPLLLAAVLIISAIGKLQAPERAQAAFTAMGVPSRLNRPMIAAAHPWAEIALAGLLLVVSGPVGVVVAAAALLLMLGYVGLVARALRSPVDVDCACFGALGGDRVTVGTLWRNAWLTTLAGTTLWCALEGRAVVRRIGELDSPSSWWLGAVVAAAVTAALVLGTGAQGRVEAETEHAEYAADVLDYVRSRTPAVPVERADGSSIDLRTLSESKAQLLVFVSEGCGSCTAIIGSVAGWREQLEQLDVRLVVPYSGSVSKLPKTELAMSLHDVHRWAGRSLGTTSTPSAVLLGADGLLAGGPVVGDRAVPEFIQEVQESLNGWAD